MGDTLTVEEEEEDIKARAVAPAAVTVDKVVDMVEVAEAMEGRVEATSNRVSVCTVSFNLGV